jgi:alpha-tubulin suppressor-like RCC1 family protein/serine/threonine protein kinase
VTSTGVDRELPSLPGLDTEFELVRELGRGGTAAVYLATERDLARPVAIKVIHPALAVDEETVKRLVLEARTLARLDHPNIIRLYGTRRLEDGRLALIMQYAGVETLRARLRAAGPLSFASAEALLTDIAGALVHAHRYRIVHRDIKPENIYIDAITGSARLSDFGIARIWGHDAGLTLGGIALGTPTYMSPEQIDGAEVDGRSDLYSLGLIGWEMLAGRRPWEGESLYGIIFKQKHEPLPRLTPLRPGIPETLRVAIEVALAKDPADRWPDAETFLRQLAGRMPRGTQIPVTGIEYDRSTPSVSTPPAPRTHTLPPGPSPREPDPSGDLPTIRFRRPPDGVVEAEVMADVLAEAGLIEPPDRPRRRAAYAAGEADWRKRIPERRRHRRGLFTALGLLVLLTSLGAAALAFRGVPTDPAPPESALGPDDSASRPLTYSSSRRIEVPPYNAEGIVGSPLADPIVLRIEDAEGHAVGGAVVRFQVDAGGGRIVPAEVRTDSRGIARGAWTLGPEPGLNTARATLMGDDDATVHLEAYGRTAVPARLAILAGQRLQGPPLATLTDTISIRVEDARGRPLAGVAVRFRTVEGGGSIRRRALETDAAGLVHATWTLGAAEELNAAVATIDGVPGVQVRLEALATRPDLIPRPALAAGGTHTCSLTGSGQLSCWGGNARGQTGTGAGWPLTPERVVAPGTFATVAAGAFHTCALSTSGGAFCWGANERGQLGDGLRAARQLPCAVTGEIGFASIAAGLAHTCALTHHGAAYCWGANESGQLGDGSHIDRAVPTAATTPPAFRSLLTGWTHTCALTHDGMVYCWGQNGNGQLGDGTTADRATPIAVAGSLRVRALAAGNAHTCAITGTGELYCWGRNDDGQLGMGDRLDRVAPALVAIDLPLVQVSAGGVHTCGLTVEGTAYCWGRNLYGQVGDGTTTDRAFPTPVAGALRFTTIQANGAHTCATARTGGHYCWGYNADGQLGDGTRTNQLRPVAVQRSNH